MSEDHKWRLLIVFFVYILNFLIDCFIGCDSNMALLLKSMELNQEATI